MKHEYTEHEEKRNNGASVMQYIEPTDRRATEKQSCILRKGWGKVESFT